MYSRVTPLCTLEGVRVLCSVITASKLHAVLITNTPKYYLSSAGGSFFHKDDRQPIYQRFMLSSLAIFPL